jgi:UDP:flavonoid glycosyltransferase YjiC (YdhE family)
VPASPVLLTPVGSAGDNLPFIGLGRELARRGYDVTVATVDSFAYPVLQSGLAFLSLGTEDEYRAATDDPDLFHPRKGFPAVMQRVAEYNRRLFDIVAERQARGPLTVVAHSLDFASRVIADADADADAASESSRLRVVRVHLQPTIVRTSYRVPLMIGTRDVSFLPRWLKRTVWSLVDRFMIDPAAAPVVNEMRARVGLEPVRRIFASQIDSPLLTIALFPEWYAPPQPDWPPYLEQCGFPLFDAPGSGGLQPEVERFLDGGPAPIVFTPGTAMRRGHEFFAAAIEACVRLGHRGMLLTSHPEHDPASQPESLALYDYAPLSDVLPRASALVHHGGIGTTAAGFAAGVPQVVVPFSHDQPDNADRVVRLGVGRRIMPKHFDAAHLAPVLEALLGSENVRRGCREIAALTAATDGIGRACDLVETVMQRGHGAPRSPPAHSPTAGSAG